MYDNSLSLIVLPSIPLTNVIFPAFMTPYITMLLFPFWGIWLILSEWFILIRLERREGQTGKWRLLRYIVVANLVSSLIGIGISLVLPSGLRTHDYPQHGGQLISILEQGERWGWYALSSFFLAYILSIGIEGAVLKQRAGYGITQSWKKSLIMNSTSYGGMLLFALLVEVLS